MGYFELIAEIIIHELVHLMLPQFVLLLQRLVLILMVSNSPSLFSFNLSQRAYLRLLLLEGPLVGIGEIVGVGDG